MADSDAAAQPTTSLVERVHGFLSEHKRAILIGAAVVVAAGGVAYYASSSSSTSRPPSPSESGHGESVKKKKKKSNKKKKAAKDTGSGGPILEEIVPPTKAVKSEDVDVDAAIAAFAGAESLSVEERTKLASELKAKGNKAYGDRKFEDAVKYYTRAIELSPKPEPVFFSNRAASYMYFPTPEYEKAVADCTEALKINPKHERSIQRRGNALEKLGRLEEALRDFTAVTLLGKFMDSGAASAVERVLKKLTEGKAKEIFSKREPRLPPHSFVDAYFGAFRPRPIPTLPAEPSQGDSTLKLALEALSARDYAHSVSLVNEALAQGISFPEGQAQALNLRGSYRFLWGDSQGAREDLEAAIEALPAFTQSWVKIASVHMEQGDANAAFEAFEQAIKHDPNDPDIYYHRGQVMFIMSQFDEAAENYSKSMELDPTFVFSQIQLAVAQYKAGRLQNAMATFRRALKTFPDRSEPNNYYGELLLDQKRYEDAIEKFDRAIELEKQKKEKQNPAQPINVLAMVNKGLTVFQWKNDLGEAERIINEALEFDPECEAAVATLAQISLQQGKVERAGELFRKQVDLARTEGDIANALQFAYAAEAQYEFAKNYPDVAQTYRYTEDQTRTAMTM